MTLVCKISVVRTLSPLAVSTVPMVTVGCKIGGPIGVTELSVAFSGAAGCKTELGVRFSRAVGCKMGGPSGLTALLIVVFSRVSFRCK